MKMRGEALKAKRAQSEATKPLTEGRGLVVGVVYIAPQRKKPAKKSQASVSVGVLQARWT